MARTSTAPTKDSLHDLYDEVIGQDDVVAQLREMARHPVHAYLFTGPAGVGKEEAAQSFAASLLCEEQGCSRCWHCRAVKERRHPDYVVLERSGASISVDQARQVAALAVRMPSVARRLVVVLPDFHLADEAAPALLKTFEEPPASTVFVILADQITPRLVTVASRCVEVHFRPLSPAQVAQSLTESGVDPQSASTLAALSAGRLDRARAASVDPSIVARFELWRSVAHRLDGSGAICAQVASELLASVDESLDALRQSQEAEAAEASEASAQGRDAPLRSELVLRHRRQQRQVRTEELRFGLAAIAGGYRDAFLSTFDPDIGGPAEGAAGLGSPRSAPHWIDAVRLTEEASRALDRNPNEALLIQALLVRLSKLA